MKIEDIPAINRNNVILYGLAMCLHAKDKAAGLSLKDWDSQGPDARNAYLFNAKQLMGLFEEIGLELVEVPDVA